MDILRDRNQTKSVKPTDQMKEHVEMDHNQDMYEKENFHPMSLKEIAASSQKVLNKTNPLPNDPVVGNANDTFTHETEVLKPSNNTTFDQTSDDDDSFISTNDNLSFLTEGFNNIKLDGEGRRSSAPIVNSTMHAGEQPHFQPETVNTTLTLSPISDSSQKANTTLTGDTEAAGNDITALKFDVASQEKVDTLDEITAAFAKTVEEKSVVMEQPAFVPISPIYPPMKEVSSEFVSSSDITPHETNIISSDKDITAENTQENDPIIPRNTERSQEAFEKPPELENADITREIEDVVCENDGAAIENAHEAQNVTKNVEIEHPNLPEHIENSEKAQNVTYENLEADFQNPPVPENADMTQNVAHEAEHDEAAPENANLTFPHPTENAQEFNSTYPEPNEYAQKDVNLSMPTPMEVDQTFGDDGESAQEQQEEITLEVPQQVFKCDFVAESERELTFEFKTPELAEQVIKTENSQDNLEMESPPAVELQSPEEFKVPTLPKRLSVEKFESASTYNFGNFDLDILQEYGSNSSPDYSVGRDSVLLRFDPLLEKIAPVEATNQRPTPTANNNNITRLATTKEEEDEHCSEDQSSSDKQQDLIPFDTSFTSPTNYIAPLYSSPPSNAETSAMKDIDQGNEIIESVHESKEFKDLSISDNNQQQLLEQQEIEFKQKMTELESQLRKEAEIKEEALLKRITEKEKQMAKMNNVVEAYEKAISELIAEKEQLIQSYEKKCLELKSDSETNSHHLASLESTFSDLHSKYERTKQIASELKEREETIITDRKSLQESLKLQEARYEKMKQHAMSQLEIANNKLAEMQRNHQAEATKLKAQLKKEEISRASVNEQLIQKSKENAELVKICDELIGNHGHSQNA